MRHSTQELARVCGVPPTYAAKQRVLSLFCQHRNLRGKAFLFVWIEIQFHFKNKVELNEAICYFLHRFLCLRGAQSSTGQKVKKVRDPFDKWRVMILFPLF